MRLHVILDLPQEQKLVERTLAPGKEHEGLHDCQLFMIVTVTQLHSQVLVQWKLGMGLLTK